MSTASTSGFGTHITIPDAKVQKSDDGKQYHAFNLYVNGYYHAVTRYSELRAIAERLDINARIKVPDFPPKRILTLLNDNQLNDRRTLLQSYFQSVMTHPLCEKARSKMNAELLRLQVDSFRPTTKQVSLDVHLADNKTKCAIKCSVYDNTDAILQIYAQANNLDSKALPYLALFLVIHDPNCTSVTQNCVRYLREYESPYITLQSEGQRQGKVHKVVILRWCWELTLEQTYLRTCQHTLAILVAQIMDELIVYGVDDESEIQHYLLLHEQDRLKDIVTECEKLKNYGLWRLRDVLVTFPNSTPVKCRLFAGRRSLVLHLVDEDKLIQYRITRIRLWKLDSKDTLWTEPILELEYLQDNGKFITIHIETRQASLLSHILHAITGNMLMLKRLGEVPDVTPTSKLANGVQSAPVDSAQPSTSHQEVAIESKQQNKIAKEKENRYETFTDVLTQMGSSLVPNRSRQVAASAVNGTSTPMSTSNATFNQISNDDL